MKKQLLLFAVFLCAGAAGKAQSVAAMKDTIAMYAPHVPNTHRWTTEDGKKWHDGLNAQFTHETQDTVKMWIANFPTESHKYHDKLEPMLEAINPDSLSEDDKADYWDIHAIWLMIFANHQH